VLPELTDSKRISGIKINDGIFISELPRTRQNCSDEKVLVDNRLCHDSICCIPRNPGLWLSTSHLFQKIKIHHSFIMNYIVIT